MKNETLIRKYKKSDRETVLNLLRLNTPDFFSPDEENDFIYYLENEIEYYFVIEMNGKIIGSGGFNFSGEKRFAKISRDILHPDFQRMSFGSKLLQYRIDKLQQLNVPVIIVRTSQLAHKFYQKQGFELMKIIEDYWAKDFHLYKMKYVKEKADVTG